MTTRTLRTIAREIRATWTAPHYGAVPYIDAMAQLDTVDDAYGYERGRGIVRYFLANAQGWRGEDARRIKAELKIMIGAR